MPENKNIRKSFMDRFTPQDGGVSIQIENVRTGRSHQHMNHQNPNIVRDNVRLQELVRDFVEKGCFSEIESLLKNSLDRVTPVDGGTIRLYRGIAMDTITANNLKALGPNELKTSSGRYHIRGAVALYLTDKPEFIAEEIHCRRYGQQEYVIDVSRLRIADVCNISEEDNILGIAFDIGESGATSGGYSVKDGLIAKGADEYLFCQLLAKMLKDRGWDGVMVPGVHGEQNNTYCNLCIFEPKALDWRTWVDGDIVEVHSPT